MKIERKIKLRLLLLIVCSCKLVTLSFAQQEPMMSQYLFNYGVMNPAYVGSHEYPTVLLAHRTQWTGVAGAPSFNMLAGDMLFKKFNSGAGTIISQESMGATQKLNLLFNYSYHLKLTDDTKLGLGVRGGLSSIRTNNSNVLVWDKDDENFPAGNISSISPVIGSGVYLYSTKYFVGISTPSFLAIKTNTYLPSTHLYLFAGYVYKVSESISLKPTLLIKYQQATPMQADAGINISFMKSLWLGFTYRTGESVVALAQYNISKRLRLGYSFDWITSDKLPGAGASHEIMLSFDFLKDHSNVIDPRDF